MRHLYHILCLLLLMMLAQHGAAVHELSHVHGVDAIDVRADASNAADNTCALCPVYAQAVTPAFSHVFHAPVLVHANPDRSAEPRYSAVTTPVPTPRSRGPPSIS
jgi:hypothetical protein